METIGSYELTKRLGSGTFGTVWLARNQATGWLRAIKLANDPQVVHQFKTEAATLDRLRHPHIVQVYEFIDDPDRPGIIFEYIEGGDLSKRLKEGPLPWREAVRIALETLEALQAAHEAGLIHRDIKPSNILLTEHGRVKVADFGLVSAAERAGSLLVSQEEGGTSSIAGTAHYMAPEYDEGPRPSPQADLFSLGVVLYQCLTGRLPRGFPKPASQLVDDCPESLDGAVMALLEVDPADRPGSAGEAHDRLSGALQQGLRAEQEARQRQEAEKRRARKAEEQREKEAAAAQARREREAREARERQAAQEKRQREAQEQRAREATAAQARREREAREAEGARRRALEEQQRREAERVARQAELSALLRDRRLHIAAVVVAVVLVGGLLSSILKRPGETTESPEVGATAALVGQTGNASGSDTSLSPGSRAGEEMTGPDGGTYVWVPAGEFMMGSDEGSQDEKPVHRAQITKGFWLGKHEVTNAQYAAFLNAYDSNYDSAGHELLDIDSRFCAIERRVGGYGAKSGPEQHPVVEVSWYGAAEYCKHYGLRLPTEAEWEYGARGPEGRKYPWGHRWDSEKCCNTGNRGPDGRTFPIGSFRDGASWCGALDMAGNVWEWCSDRYSYTYYTGSPDTDPAGPATGNWRVLRGGSCSNDGDICRSLNRNDGGYSRAASVVLRVDQQRRLLPLSLPLLQMAPLRDSGNNADRNCRSANRCTNFPDNTCNGVGFRCVRTP